MADGEQRGFDRVRPPGAARPRRRDPSGKEALYSTAPDAAPTATLLVVCARCDVETGMSLWDAKALLRPPFFINPLSNTMWGRCPACERRSWLHVRGGPGLRAWTGRG